MDETSFHERADDLLSSLYEAAESANEEGALEADLVEGVLTLKLEDGNEFVINKHEPSRKIWVSSPVSGASRFTYNEDDDEWLNSEGELFRERIVEELAQLASIDLEF